VIDRALRQERRLGRAGHTAYDLVRHAVLSRLFRYERTELGALLARERHRAPRQQVHD
jgi:hypothetical protein